MVPNFGFFVGLWRRVQRSAHRFVAAVRDLLFGKGPVGFDLSHPEIAAQLARAFADIDRHRRVTQLITGALPSEEAPFAHILRVQLGNLETCVSSFDAAVALFDRFSRDVASPDFRFVHLAARDGTLSLWNFAMALNAIKSSLDAAPTLRTRMSVTEVEAATSRFWAAVPHTEGLRNSSGHTSELMKSPRAWARNALKDGRISDQINIGGNSFWLGNIIGRKYSTTTFNGELVEYEITTDTLDKLKEITAQVFGAISLPPPRT